jgi:hypothetical protein
MVVVGCRRSWGFVCYLHEERRFSLLQDISQNHKLPKEENLFLLLLMPLYKQQAATCYRIRRYSRYELLLLDQRLWLKVSSKIKL